jgi:hypothetical protein
VILDEVETEKPPPIAEGGSATTRRVYHNLIETAGRVMDIDQKRQKSLAYVSRLDKKEWIDAKRCIRENGHVVEIVYQCLTDRVASFHFALERLVIETQKAQAVEGYECSINCRGRSIAIARCRRPGCVSRASLRTTEFLLALRPRRFHLRRAL